MKFKKKNLLREVYFDPVFGSIGINVKFAKRANSLLLPPLSLPSFFIGMENMQPLEKEEEEARSASLRP